MALDQKKYERKHEAILRDSRPMSVRLMTGLAHSSYSAAMFLIAAVAIFINKWALTFADLICVFMALYFWWLTTRDRSLAFKLPRGSKYLDGNAGRKGTKGKAEGILYLGNVERTNEEVWFSNSDARTHVLYLGTTGAGKTEGLKSIVTNAMTWSSGFVYVDGKADTDLWSSLSALLRRFGRDDDMLVLNYMTGNSDSQAPSNTMNPFSSGSASYLTNMLVSLMPDGGGDNAMWKERAVSLVGSMMPVLTWKRDHQDIPMSVRTIREYLSLNNVIKLARDEAVPKEVRAGVNGYLDTLPGFVGAAYDDNGQVKPPGPDTPQYNTETASQQHGYLAMQFTRSLQSLGDDYGYIFDTQAADVDMVDVVLNRRILVVLVPALEKSGDEVANLGKIVAASIKGMMGSTLGSTVEGSSETVIENKPTHSGTPFITVFDEVGYYVAEGMAVMAAQARSLGFCLVFSGQDLPALKKRVREEANSITANCNIKIFGKLEDPTETKEFFEKTVGSAMVTEVSGYQMQGGSDTGAYYDTLQASVQLRPRAVYDELRGFKEGQAVITFGEVVVDCSMFYSNPGFAKAMRVTRFTALPPPDENMVKHANAITKLRDMMVNKTWTAMRADVAVETTAEIAALNDGFKSAKKPGINPIDAGIVAVVQVHCIDNAMPEPTGDLPPAGGSNSGGTSSGGGGGVSPALRDTIPPMMPPQAPVASPVVSPLAGVGVAAAAQQSPLAAKKPVDIIAAGAVQAPTPATQAPPPVNTTTDTAAKPSIFGTPKPIETSAAPPPVIAPVPLTAQSAAPTAKPAIFGAPKPAAEQPPAVPQQTQELPASQALPAAPPVIPTAQETLSSAPPSAAKPAIFGAPKPAAEQPPAVVPPQAQELPASSALPAAPPVIPTAQETLPSAPPPAAKPAIFGAPKPAEVVLPPQAQETSADEDALRKAAEEAKKNLFGGDPSDDGQNEN